MNKNNQGIKIEEYNEINSSIITTKEFISTLKIDLGQGKTKLLNIYKNSKPDELAYNFCLQNHLDFKSVILLIKKIKYFKENNKKDKLINSLDNINIKDSKDVFEYSFKNKKNGVKNYLIRNNRNENKLKNFHNKEIISIKNNNLNSDELTSINYCSKSNSSDRNLSISNIFGSNTIKNDKKLIHNNNLNNIHINSDINNVSENYQKDSNNNSNYSQWTCNFNDSINDKLNNLEKAYANFNPENKKIKNENIYNSNDRINKKESISSTKEIISEAIQNCMQAVENEEKNDNNINASGSNNNNSDERKEFEMKYKTISIDVNDIVNIQNNNMIRYNEHNISFEKNDNNILNTKNKFLTPKKIKELNLNENILIQNNIQKNNSSNKLLDNICYKNTLLKIFSFNDNNNENNNNITLGNKNFYNNEEEQVNQEKEININKFENNSITNDIIKDHKEIYSILNINNNTENNNNLNYNSNSSIKSITNGNKFENNNIMMIKNEINFSLLSTFSFIQKDINNYINNINNDNKSYKKILPKTSTFHREDIENGKKLGFFGALNNNNSIKDNTNNSFSYNAFHKDYYTNDNNIIINNIKRIKNFSLIKNNDNNENCRCSNSKDSKSLNKCRLLSITMSEKNILNFIKKNSKNKTRDINRTMATSIGNDTNNSNFLTHGSSIKLCNHKNYINSNISNKKPLNQTFNFSNEFLFRRQKRIENNNSNNNQIINSLQKVYYTNSKTENNTIRSQNYNNTFKTTKNKGIIFSNNLCKSIAISSSNHKENSLDYLKSRVKCNIRPTYKKISYFKINNNNKDKNFNYNRIHCQRHYKLNKNNLAQNLYTKNEIINSLKKIFYYINKNSKIMDVFSVMNRKNIPKEIFNIFKTIIKSCNNKKRFIEYKEFINEAFYIFDLLPKDEKIAILNFNIENIKKVNNI